MKIYHDSDADLSLIKGKKIAIIGYGSQGHAHALNLRDSKVEVRVGLRASSASCAKARDAGFEVMTPAEAAKWADVVVLLAPDETQAEIYEKEIAPNVKQGASLAFAHGFNVHFGYIKPRADMDVWMIAPKEIGPVVRSEYEKGGGVPALVAVHQDASGSATKLALAYGAAIGCGRVGMFESTFREECEIDLFGEQAVLFGGLPPLMRAAYETLVEGGYSPEAAYFKCVQQVKLVADVIYKSGISGMNAAISKTAEYGGYVAASHIVTSQTKKEMKHVLTDIQSGAFARRWMAENKAGKPSFTKQRKLAQEHPMEAVGRKLRDLMTKAAKDK